MKFPNKCCQCGMCCLSTPCPIAMEYAPSAVKGKPCPFLAFAKRLAVCLLMNDLIRQKPEITNEIMEAFGVGQGCCIKAHAVNSQLGIAVNFADLSDETKRDLVKGELK